MSEVNNIQNLNAHYSKETKVKRSSPVADTVQYDLRAKRVFNDKEANQKMRAINEDIYTGMQQVKRSEKTSFAQWFAGAVAVILLCLGLKRFFR